VAYEAKAKNALDLTHLNVTSRTNSVYSFSKRKWEEFGELVRRYYLERGNVFVHGGEPADVGRMDGWKDLEKVFDTYQAWEVHGKRLKKMTSIQFSTS
jgi:hypothetical protein